MAITLYELLGADDRRFSPYCWRTPMALAHKGLRPEIIPCKFTDKHLFAFSGQDKVPAPTFSRHLLLTVIKDIFDHVHPDDKAYFRKSREERFGKTLEQLRAESSNHRAAIEADMATSVSMCHFL